MNIYILTNGLTSFTDILLGGVIAAHHEHIKGIIVEDEAENLKTIDVAWRLWKKAGTRFVIYKAMEAIFYRVVLFLKKFTHRRRLQNGYELARKYNIPVSSSVDVESPRFRRYFRERKPDIVLLIGYSNILTKKFLRIPKIGTLNFHPGILPKYKGFFSLFYALIAKEEIYGASIHEVEKSVHSGKVVGHMELPVYKGKSLAYHNLQLHRQGREWLRGVMGKIIKYGNIFYEKSEDDGNYFGFPTKVKVKKFRRKVGKIMRLRDFKEIWDLL